MIEEREGGLDTLVNNAGIIRVCPLNELSVEEWELLQKVNTTSALLGMKAAFPAMARRGGGTIINIASTAAHRAAEAYGAYSASKAAVIALTRAAALEFAPHIIRVNSISPGGVETPMNDDKRHFIQRSSGPRCPAGRDLAPGGVPRFSLLLLCHRSRLPAVGQSLALDIAPVDVTGTDGRPGFPSPSTSGTETPSWQHLSATCPLLAAASTPSPTSQASLRPRRMKQ